MYTSVVEQGSQYLFSTTLYFHRVADNANQRTEPYPHAPGLDEPNLTGPFSALGPPTELVDEPKNLTGLYQITFAKIRVEISACICVVFNSHLSELSVNSQTYFYTVRHVRSPPHLHVVPD